MRAPAGGADTRARFFAGVRTGGATLAGRVAKTGGEAFPTEVRGGGVAVLTA